MKRKDILKYDNTFNKTSLSLLTKVQADILLNVLGNMGECVDEQKCYKAVFSFNEIREMIGCESMQTNRIKKVFDTLLDTKVEFFYENRYEKGNLFSHYCLNDNNEAEIVLTENMTNKLLVDSKEYTILDLDEYTSLPNIYSKEIYRLLRQFRYSGMRILKKSELLSMINPPKSYNEYDIIRKILKPALKNNEEYFKNLTTNIKSNKIPEVIKFYFLPHEKNPKKYINKNSKSNEKDLLEYVKNNTKN